MFNNYLRVLVFVDFVTSSAKLTNQNTMKKLLSIIFLLATTVLFSQEFSMDLVKNMKPRSIGPGGMSGRVTSIDVVQNNTNIMYAGTASGGLWKSTSAGVKWKPIFDNEATASIGAVAIQQSNPSVIWV